MQRQPSIDRQSLSYHLIFNPVSGSGDPGPKLMEIETALDSLQDFTAHLTKPERGVEELVQQALAEGADVILAAGGDGTISGAAAVLMETDIPLGIIPTGTANGFATAVGIPENLTDACEVIKSGRYHRVDTARCHDRIMLLTTCIGFEANLLTEMDREEKSRLGKLAIATNSLRQLSDLKQFDIQLETPDHTWNQSATAVTIANTAAVSMVLAQGPANIADDDGKLSITVVTPNHQWEMLTSATDLFLSALQERSAQHEHIHACKAERVTITAEPTQRVFIDGEPAGETPLTVECCPQSLTVLVPTTDASDRSST